jgi:Ca2+-binding EF-hand superfamily protein
LIGKHHVSLGHQSMQLTAEQQHIRMLLNIVSGKISERFKNLQSCFRFLDVDHTQSITLNEFAQAMEHMRIKLSFDDIKTLFRYLD